jgi:8-oxo-dGTP pyrophosphatase MutT (NUDIX family)
MKHLILHKTDWFNIAQYRDYQYFHQTEPRTIAVLPIIPLTALLRWSNGASPDREEELLILRKEDLPCWQVNYEGLDELHWCSVTGGCNPGESELDTMVREVEEECGLRLVKYSVDVEGRTQVGKYTNMNVTMMLLRVEEAIVVDIKPDSKFEARAENHYVKMSEISRIWDELDQSAKYLIRWYGAPLAMRPRSEVIHGEF